MVAQRNQKGQFVKGTCPNPGGRPKGLRERAREATKDGEKLVKFFENVLDSEALEIRDRMEAGKWLADRGWGKAAQPITGDEEQPLRIRLTWGGDAGDEPA